MLKRSLYFLFSLSLVSLYSCDPDYYYHQQFEIPNQQWNYIDTLDFAVAIQDTSAIYDLYIDIEHASNYSYQNIYLNIFTKFPAGERLKELLSINLANKAGLWYGNCSEDWCKLQIPVQEGAYFNKPGSYIFTFGQYMRLDPLPGIKSIAFSIKETGEKRQ